MMYTPKGRDVWHLTFMVVDWRFDDIGPFVGFARVRDVGVVEMMDSSPWILLQPRYRNRSTKRVVYNGW